MTPFQTFIEAVQNNDLARVAVMLNTINAKNDDSLALRTAAQYGFLDMVRLLLPHSQPDAKQSTPICLAAERGHLEIVKILTPFSDLSVSEWYVLRESAGCGQTHVVEWLLPLCPEEEKASAITVASMGDHDETVDFLKDKVDFTHKVSWPLDWCVRNDNTTIFDLLLPYVNAEETNDFYTALNSAAYHGREHMLKRLLDLVEPDSALDKILENAALGGSCGAADLLYDRCNVDAVLHTLQQQHLNRYDKWAFLDQRVQSQRQKDLLTQVVDGQTLAPKTRKI